MDLFMHCPVRGCPVRQQVSHEDPDASQSELWGHFVSGHPRLEPRTLLDRAQAVDAAGRVLSDAEIQQWMFTDSQN